MGQLLIRLCASAEAFSSKSARGLGIGLILASVPFAMALNRETPALAAGMLACGIFFCLASTAFARSGRLLPPLLILAGIGSGAAISIVGIMTSPLVRKSSESVTKGSLGALRSSLSHYYGDAKGYPEDLTVLTRSAKYLLSSPEIPVAKLQPYHPDSAAVHVRDASNDAGGWLYDPKRIETDKVLRVNCTHTDSKGKVWTSY